MLRRSGHMMEDAPCRLTLLRSKKLVAVKDISVRPVSIYVGESLVSGWIHDIDGHWAVRRSLEHAFISFNIAISFVKGAELLHIFGLLLSVWLLV